MTGERAPALVVAALGSGLVAGCFAVFSLVVMPALVALPAGAGLAAMQAVNRTAVRPVFMLLLFGTGMLCLVLAAAELAGGRGLLVPVAAAVYLAGVVGVTVLANVPINDALAALDAGTAGAARAWRDSAGAWTGWNTVRSLAALVSAGLLVAAVSGRG